MEKCLVNPEMSKENKTEMLSILGYAQAEYGDFSNKKLSDIITNSDILFK